MTQPPAASPPLRTPLTREIAAMVALSTPLAAANLLQMAVWAIDVVFLARLGTVTLAAASLSFALFGTLAWALSGLTGMVAALISAALGRGTGVVREVRRATRMALWLAVLCGAGVAVLCLFGREIMLLTGQSDEIAARADPFLALIGLAAVPMLIANVLRSYVSALGRPVFATVIVGLSVLVAAAGNYALVFGHFGAPRMGMMGSAAASNITAWLTVAAYVAVIQFDRRLARFRIFGRLWAADWRYFRQLARLGAPVALTIIAEGGMFNSAAFLMGRLGASELAAHTLALQIGAFAFQVPFGVAQAATIRVGYHYGAGDRGGIARAGWCAVLVGIGFAGLSAAAMLIAPRTLLSLYVDPARPANAALVALAVQYLTVAAAFQLFDGLQAVAAGTLRGLQDTRLPMILALAGYWGPGFGSMVLLGFFTPLGGIGVWLGMMAGLAVVASALMARWLMRARLGLLPPPAG